MPQSNPGGENGNTDPNADLKEKKTVEGDGTGNDPGEKDPSVKAQGENHQEEEVDDSAWDSKTKDYIQSLRKENAKYRTSAKERDDRLTSLEEMQSKRDKALKAALGIEDEDDTPIEDKFEAAQMESANLQFKNEVLSLAIENGIGGDQAEYFEFLIGKAVSELDEDGEITEEDIDSIVARVKGASGNANAGNGSTSINKGADGKQDPNPSAGSESIGVEDFANMSFSKKGELFGKNPDLYKKLNAEAVAKGLL